MRNRRGDLPASLRHEADTLALRGLGRVILARPPPHNTRVEGRTYRRRQISRPPKEMAERTQDIAAPYINAFGLREGLLECTPSRIGTIVGLRVAELSQMCRESHPWNGRG